MQIFQSSKVALGTEIILTIVDAKSSKQPSMVFENLWRKINEFDNNYSRFKKDSPLTALNESPGEKIIISDEFREILTICKNLWSQTDGVFNPLILPALQLAGYKESWAPNDTTNQPPDYSDRDVGDMNDLFIGKDFVILPKNTAIDLGGIGKGYLLDQLALILKDKNISNYWLSLGGDIIASGKDAQGAPWKIEVVNAQEPNKVIGFAEALDDKPLAIATSGITKRKGEHNNNPWHHIIDPKTKLPAKTDIKTVTVCSSNATFADVYASCLVIIGSKKFKKFINNKPISSLLIQTENSKILEGKQITLT